jgi:hypothetical protein
LISGNSSTFRAFCFSQGGVRAGICSFMDVIMRSSFWRCRFVVAMVTVFLGLILARPRSAQAGFFDDIFGQQFRPPSYRDYGPWRPEPGFRRRGNNWSYRRSRKSASHSAHKKIIVAARTNQAQEPVDIMEDDSLRKGDVVMTKAGIRVFIGYSMLIRFLDICGRCHSYPFRYNNRETADIFGTAIKVC